MGTLFPLTRAVRNAVRNAVINSIDKDWFLRKGLIHALRIPLAHAVVISDTLKINPEFQTNLDSCLYVRENRALFFFESGIYFFDVGRCISESFASENAKTLEKVKSLLNTQDKKTSPESLLMSLMKQAR